MLIPTGVCPLHTRTPPQVRGFRSRANERAAAGLLLWPACHCTALDASTGHSMECRPWVSTATVPTRTFACHQAGAGLDALRPPGECTAIHRRSRPHTPHTCIRPWSTPRTAPCSGIAAGNVITHTRDVMSGTLCHNQLTRCSGTRLCCNPPRATQTHTTAITQFMHHFHLHSMIRLHTPHLQGCQHNPPSACLAHCSVATLGPGQHPTSWLDGTRRTTLSVTGDQGSATRSACYHLKQRCAKDVLNMCCHR